MEPASNSAATRTQWAVALVGLAALALHGSAYLPFVADDALISLRYAQRLLAGHGLTWTDGECVEGYSNLLWVLLCAAGGALGLDLIDAARTVGLLAGGAALVAVVRADRPGSPADSLPCAFGAWAIAASGTIAVWSIGGLEQPLVAALLAWALVTSYPLLEPGGRVVVPGVLLALLCWTRPDGFLFSAAIAAGIVLGRGAGRTAWRDAARLVALPVLAVLAQLAFRLAYYGEWVPNTAHGKLAFTARRFTEGLAYVGEGSLYLGALLVPGILLALVYRRRDADTARRVVLLLMPLLLWTGYVLAIGGDIFPARRHMTPIVVTSALLAVEGVRALLRARRMPARTSWSAALVLLAILALCQWQDPENVRAKTERWEWDGQVVGRLLKAAFGEQRPLLAVDPAGTLPYFSELPAIDMMGLNDRYLAKNPPPDLGQGILGHELGEGRYVLEREPDLVLFTTPRGGPPSRFRSGLEMYRDPRFAATYRLVGFEGNDPFTFRSAIWVRVEGGRIGIVRTPSRVVVPGHLLSANMMRGSLAKLDGEGRIGTVVTPGLSAAIEALPLEAGKWQLRIEHSGGPIQARVRSAGTTSVLAQGADTLAFARPAAGPGAVEVEVIVPPGKTAHITRLVLERQP